jgi:hypothetical protein
MVDKLQVGDVVWRIAEPDGKGKVIRIEQRVFTTAIIVWDKFPQLESPASRDVWEFYAVQPPEQPRTGSAKFDGDPIREFLWMISMHTGADETSGNSEAPTGWFARFSIDFSELDSLAENFAEEVELSGLTDIRAVVGHWLITENDQGAVFIESFDTEEALKARFDELDAEYSEWDIDEIDETPEMDKQELWDWLLKNGIATEDELRLVTNGWGFTIENLNIVLYVKTGCESAEQYAPEN